MQDKQLENIKSSFLSYEVKTTSEDILKAKERERKPVIETPKAPKKKFWKVFGISLSSAVALAASAVGIVFLVRNLEPFTPIEISSKQEQAAFELFVGSSLLDSKVNGINAIQPMMAYKDVLGKNGDHDEDEESLSEAQFASLVDLYHENHQTYATLIDDGVNVLTTVSTGSFTGKYGTYTNKMSLDDKYYFYYSFDFSSFESASIDAEYSGELSFLDSFYLVDLEIKSNANTNKKEVEMKIHYSNSEVLDIEYATRTGKTSYEFSYYQNGSKIKAVEIEIKQKSAQRHLELEIEEGDVESSFVIQKQSDTSYILTYSYLDDYEGSIRLSISGTSYTYLETSLKYQIIK